jgi:spore germination protein KC
LRSLRMLLLSLAIIPILTGCWNRIEVNDIAIVTATGIDKLDNDDIRLSLQVGIPATIGLSGAGGSNGKRNSTFTVSESGETISDAYRKIQEKMSRRIFLSHSRVLIIGEKLARDGVAHIIDFFARYQDPRLNAFIMFTRGEASDILKNKSLIEKIPSEETRELIKQGIGLKVTIKDFWDMIIADGIEPVAPRFKIVPLEVKSKDEENESSPVQNVQAITGAAVFKEDKLVGWMNDAETRGILHLRDELELGVVTVNIPEEKGGGKVSVKISRVTTAIKPKLHGGHLMMDVISRSEANVLENASEINLSKLEELEFLQTKLEEDIKQRIELALNKAQKKYRSDIFGFGRVLYRAYPRAWNKTYKKKWDSEFPELEITIKPQVIVKQIGLAKKTR